jgi:hypothetical protein
VNHIDVPPVYRAEAREIKLRACDGENSAINTRIVSNLNLLW